MALVNGPIDELRIYVPPSDKNGEMLDDATMSRLLTLPFHIYKPSYLNKLSLQNCYPTDLRFSMCCFSNLVSLRLLTVEGGVLILEALIYRSATRKILVLIDLYITGGNSPLVVKGREFRTSEYRSSQSSLSLNYFPCLTSATIYAKIEISARKLERSFFSSLSISFTKLRISILTIQQCL